MSGLLTTVVIGFAGLKLSLLMGYFIINVRKMCN